MRIRNLLARRSHYSLGVIAWAKWYPEYTAARERLGMKPDEPGPLTDAPVRAELRSRRGKMVDEGIAHLEKALELDPQYDDAMAYINLLIRERADLADTVEQYRGEVETADRWLQKALAAKAAKSQAALPPDLPPPPDGVQRIRVWGALQGRKLIHSVEAVYPPTARQARIRGLVRLTVLIGVDGRVQHVHLISGHPLLAPAAIDAVRQWVYEPTLCNGQAAEVLTTVDVNFISEGFDAHPRDSLTRDRVFVQPLP